MWLSPNGTVVPWYHGTMAPWRRGIMIPWCHGTMVPCHHGTMVPWYHGTMVPWHHGIMVLLYHGTMAPWHGIMAGTRNQGPAAFIVQHRDVILLSPALSSSVHLSVAWGKAPAKNADPVTQAFFISCTPQKQKPLLGTLTRSPWLFFMVLWYGTMVPWYHGTMVPWHQGTMVRWCRATMVL